MSARWSSGPCASPKGTEGRPRDSSRLTRRRSAPRSGAWESDPGNRLPIPGIGSHLLAPPIGRRLTETVPTSPVPPGFLRGCASLPPRRSRGLASLVRPSHLPQPQFVAAYAHASKRLCDAIPEFSRQDRQERKDEPGPSIVPDGLGQNLPDTPRGPFEKSLAGLGVLCVLCVRTATFGVIPHSQAAGRTGCGGRRGHALALAECSLTGELLGGQPRQWFSGSASPDSRGDSSLGPGGLTRPVL